MMPMEFSPLFWPIKLKGNTIYILDETVLPKRVKYIKAKNYQQACTAIKEMKTRAVGQVLLVMYTFLLAAGKGAGIGYLEKVACAINSTRPTLSFRFLTDTVLAWAKSGTSLEKNILGFLEMLKTKRIQQAEQTSKLIKDKDVILTHCNISGLMPLIGEFCRRQNKKVSFFVTETRPYLQGSRLTAWELKRAKFLVTLITDSMVAYTMSLRKVNKVIVGADHLAGNGDIANKVGTYPIAILAKYFKIPFYCICPPTSSAKTGKDIKIEIRPSRELWEYIDRRFVPSEVKGYYPAFDITPHNLITKHIYFKIKR